MFGNFSVKSCQIHNDMGDAMRIWAMHYFISAYFDEIIIFGLSKDQTSRI
jgi:hypothetical protein